MKNIDLLSITMLVGSFVYLFLLQNKLFVKRNLKVCLMFFLISALLPIIAISLHYFEFLSLLTLAADILFMVISYITYCSNGVKNVKNIIYEHEVTLDLHSIPDHEVLFSDILNGKYDDIHSFSHEEKDKTKIYHSLSKEKIFGKLIPVFMHVFRFRMSATASLKLYDDLLNHLQLEFPEYTWTGLRTGKWFKLMAYCQNNESQALWKDIKSVSNALPWYVVPIGLKDNATYLTKTNSLYFLKLHNTPTFIEQSFDLALKRNNKTVKDVAALKIKKGMGYNEIIKTNELQSNESISSKQIASTALIVGSSNSKKIDALNAIIAHMTLNQNVNMYIHNHDQALDKNIINSLSQVKLVSKTLPESYEIIKRLLYIMTQRYNALQKLNLKNLPLSGLVNMGNRISVNGNILCANDRVHIRIAYEEKDILAQDIQPGMEIVIAGDKKFRIPNHWEFCVAESMIFGGEIEIPPIIFIIDNYQSLVESNGTIAFDDELKGITTSNVNDTTMANEIRVACEAISNYGHKVNVHLVIANESVNDQLFPISFRDNIDFRLAVDNIPHNHSKILFSNYNVNNLENSNNVLSYSVNYDQKEEWKLLHVSNKDILINALSNNEAKTGKNSSISSKKPLQSLRFDRYDGILPDMMADGVVVDYGFAGQRREVPKMSGESISLAGREINLNKSAHYKDKNVKLHGLFGDLENERRIGSVTLPNVPDFKETKVNEDEILTIDDILNQSPRNSSEENIGRVYEDDGVKILGDQSSLNSYYSKPIDDEDEPYEIVQ